jgi:hypothetical protein
MFIEAENISAVNLFSETHAFERIDYSEYRHSSVKRVLCYRM